MLLSCQLFYTLTVVFFDNSGIQTNIRISRLLSSFLLILILNCIIFFAEYGYTYKVNEKSDVYSFGVVLMELVTGKKPIEPEYGDNRDVVNWVSTNWKTKESVLSIVDSNIREVHREEAIKVLRIAILCTSRLPNMRPSMRSVVQMLEEAEPCKFIGIIISKNGGSKKEEVEDCNGEA